ncbi:hypothetical protein Tsubulata_026217 [Turnera subulata]|uniref:CSC1-like protein RXW8 n=1 Tax=Turnera subulata TaxID=218843 RepID=A0A9Q0FAM2_9ROSI|nr:hypothetical protein Tsubulata_026217 [Turnera subulata]
MDVAAFLTSAGINIGLCVMLFSLYSVLRKQPSNRIVYFGRRIASVHVRRRDLFSLERFVPSPSWLVKAWETKEDEILASGGMDAVVFQRLLVFSMRAFSIACVICIFLVLPVNYYGKCLPRVDDPHRLLSTESLEAFTISNVDKGSKWLWTHCLALYIISFSTCVLLYFEYKSITKMRLAHITRSLPSPSHFTVLVRSIPYCPGESYSDSVLKFFTNYYGSSYLSHHMVYQKGMFQRLLGDAEKICNMLKTVPLDRPGLGSCCVCPGSTTSFKILAAETESVKGSITYSDLELNTRDNECSAAFVFFKTRYSAVLCTQMLQSSNPMLWVTEMAPEPHDVLWSNLSIPYKQLWLRKIATLLAATVFMFLFLIPVTCVQGLMQLDKLSRIFPFLKGWLAKDFIGHVVTGYLPSVVLVLFLYTVPPTMMLFSSMEGPVSRSLRKRSACLKILYFTILNVFFVNVFTGSLIAQLNMLSSVKDIPAALAKAISSQILNVYVTKYESGGQLWPIVHNTTIFSLLLSQIIALGIFGLKESPVASSFTIPLVCFTLLFNEYCRKRFYPIFQKTAAQVLIEMDRRDQQRGRMEDMCQQFHMAYCQSPMSSRGYCESGHRRRKEEEKNKDPEAAKPEKGPQLQERTLSELVLCNGDEPGLR